MTENSKVDYFFEAQKLGYDTVKHLTTLSSGTIIILATFLGDLFKVPEWKILVPCIFGLFTLSIILSIITMVFLFK